MAADRQAELAAVLPENREIFARIFQNSDSDSDLENVDPGANVVGDINESDLDISDVESSESDRSSNPSDVNVDSSSSSTSSDDADDEVWSRHTRQIQLNPFVQETGPRHDLGDVSEPLDFFSLLWPDDHWETLVVETNR